MLTNSKENLLSTTLDNLDIASNLDLEVGETNPARKAGCLTRLRHTAFRSAIFILIFTGAVTLLHQAETRIHSTKQLSCNCVETVSEAILHGCKYANMTRWQRHGSLIGVETTSSLLSGILFTVLFTEERCSGRMKRVSRLRNAMLKWCIWIIAEDVSGSLTAGYDGSGSGSCAA